MNNETPQTSTSKSTVVQVAKDRLWKISIGLAVIAMAVLLLWDMLDLKSISNNVNLSSEFLYQDPDDYAHYMAAGEELLPGIHLLGFDESRDITFAHGRLYAAGDKKIVRIDPAKHGNDAETFPLNIAPQTIAIGPNGYWFVAAKDHVRVYDVNGKRQAIWPSLGDKAQIRSIAVGLHDVFVADYGSRLIYRYNHKGNRLNTIGQRPKGLPGQAGSIEPRYRNVPGFSLPSAHFDIALSSDQLLRVANAGRRRIEAYTADGYFESPLTWGQGGRKAKDFSGCCNPAHFVILSNGHYVTAEKGVQRLKEYDRHGKFLHVIAGPRELGDTRFEMALTADPKRRVYLLDNNKHIVRVFTTRPTWKTSGKSSGQ